MTPPARLRPHTVEDARQVLRSVFGFADFRPGQTPVVEAVLAGRDVLAILPTGGGKSLCYQAPALLDGGLTVVVSPLLALMRDQVLALRQLGVAAAAATSEQDARGRQEAIEAAVSGQLRLLYVSPERLADSRTVAQLRRAPLLRLAIDEAHCVSQWGFDFRPAYRQLAEARTALGDPQVIAFTATADQVVRDDIVAQLGLREPAVVVGGFDRPNLRFEVERINSLHERHERVVAHLRAAGSQPAIVYSATRRRVDELTAGLRLAGIPAAAYHAGMDGSTRRRVQDDFAHDRARVIVATVAFGMGIDKPDVRLVVHHSLPDSVEGYYQEAGRAGRDGDPARCVLLYQPADRALRVRFIDGSHPTPAVVLDMYERLVRARGDWVDIEMVAGRDLGGAGAACRVLVQCGLADMQGTLVRALRPRGQDAIDTTELEEHRRAALGRLEALIDYATSRTCLRARLLGYFGERLSGGRCGNCSACGTGDGRSRGQAAEPAVRPVEAPLSAADEARFEALRAWRARVARETQMPPYVIFHDAVLRGIARENPRTAAALRSVPGIGPAKLERYGREVLDVLAHPLLPAE